MNQLYQSVQILRGDLYTISFVASIFPAHVLSPFRSVVRNSIHNDSKSPRRAPPRPLYPCKHLQLSGHVEGTRVLACHPDRAFTSVSMLTHGKSEG